MKEENSPTHSERRYLLVKRAACVLFATIFFAYGLITLRNFLYQAYLPEIITSYIKNSLEEKISSQLDLASGDLLDIKVKEVIFNASPATILIPEISLFAATGLYIENGSVIFYEQAYEAGVVNLEFSARQLVLMSLGQRKFNITRLQADSIYFNAGYFPENPGVIFDNQPEGLDFRAVKTSDRKSEKTSASDTSRFKIQSGHIRFKGKVNVPGYGNNELENLLFEEHSFQAENLAFSLPGNLYSFHIDSISFDGTGRTISIEKVKMLPRYPKEEFYRHIDFQTDRIETHLENIEIIGFRTHKNHGRRGLMVSEINITNGFMDVSRDRRPPFDQEQRPDMPVRLIAAAPVDFFAAEINISKTDILYSEFPEDGAESDFHEAAGIVPFNRLKATVKNITNIADSLDKDSIMYINAEVFIFDDAILRAGFSYNLNDINGSYSADVELSELRFKTINPALYPLTGIKVAEGIHKSSVFSFTGNDIESSGDLYMKWDDLLLDFTPEGGEVITSITQSLGEIIYHDSNPEKVNDNPSGEIYFERDIRRFVFHYWWNCYLSGIKNSVLLDFVPL